MPAPLEPQPLPEGPTLRGLDARQRVTAGPRPCESSLSPGPHRRKSVPAPSIPAYAQGRNLARVASPLNHVVLETLGTALSQRRGSTSPTHLLRANGKTFELCG